MYFNYLDIAIEKCYEQLNYIRDSYAEVCIKHSSIKMNYNKNKILTLFAKDFYNKKYIIPD